MNKPALVTVVLLSLLLASAGTRANSYDFAFIAEKIPDNHVYGEPEEWPNQLFSVGTTLNDNGDLYGFRVTPDGQIKGYALAFRSNPALTDLESDNWLPLSASASGCFNFLGICIPTPDLAWGIKLYDTQAVSGFANTAEDAPVIAGSLPFSRYPGNFVKENNAGIIASTQLTDSGSVGAIIQSSGITVLDEVPWLIAINEHTDPQILGYQGTDARCHIYGEACLPPTDECEPHNGNGNGHHNSNGQGHHEHGQGYGYGHDHCHDDDDSHDDSTAHPEPTAGQAVLIQAYQGRQDYILYTLPNTLSVEFGGGPVSQLFPLALNNNTLVVRGHYRVNQIDYPNSLLLCRFLPDALDTQGDGELDCLNGLEPIGPVDAPIQVDTVLGFNLNNAGQLVGHYGYGAAGIGLPFIVSLNEATPSATLLSNLTDNTGERELHTISDINQAGTMTGYGFEACSLTPQAFVIEPRVDAPAGDALHIALSDFQRNTLIAPGASLTITPDVSGGSGAYDFRTEYKTPADDHWHLLQDWHPQAGTYHSEADLGEVCIRLQVRDAHNHTLTREQVVRFLVSDTPDTAPRNVMPVTGFIPVEDDPAELTPLGSLSWHGLWLWLVVLLRQRQHRAMAPH